MMSEQDSEVGGQIEQPVTNVVQALSKIESEQGTFKPTTLAERQEETRGLLAKQLIGILRWVIILLLVAGTLDKVTGAVFAFNNRKYEPASTEFKDLATLALTSLTGLAGTALGFYFGSRESASSRQES